ncbi:preprotein translocase subunit SecE [Marinilactibacillus sp. GCM10026970]|uniref:preprotein translocase subunit SecE n=1 Tax=unclassified Marinilactibacillus TaxID=2632303 RepID=UPI001CE3CFFD|nr:MULTISPECIES: preprotein translocase subunit SecE [unclassified Marinilactibacillus]MEC6749108.1 preprotein translocase subunit SecE [Marinilactibacillus sp. XAAS-LB27]
MGKIKKFFGEVKYELQETTWPTNKEMRKNTLTVFGVVAFFSVFFFGIDSIITFLLNLI